MSVHSQSERCSLFIGAECCSSVVECSAVFFAHFVVKLWGLFRRKNSLAPPKAAAGASKGHVGAVFVKSVFLVF